MIFSRLYKGASSDSTNISYAADVIYATSNQTGKDITLHAAPRSIEGRITIPNPAPAGGVSVSVDVSYYDNFTDEYFYADYTILAGSTFVDYKIGVNAQNKYRVEYSSNAYLGGFYAGENSLAEDYYISKLLSTTTNNATEINANLTEGKAVTLTLNFKSPATKSGRIIMGLSEDGDYMFSFRRVIYTTGVNQVSSTFILDPNKYHQVIAGYIDTGKLHSYSSEMNFLYYHNTKGQTSIKTEATKLDVSSAPNITITQPPVYTITGNADMNGYVPDGSEPILVAAEFSNGEVYGQYVFPDNGSSTVPFTLEVPQHELNGSYRLSVFRCSWFGEIVDGTQGYSSEMIFDTTNTEKTVSLAKSPTLIELSGTFSLPTPADKDNISVHLSFGSQTGSSQSFEYYIPKNSNSVDYKLYASSADGRIYAYLYNAPITILDEAYLDTDGNTTELNFTAETALLITGKIKNSG